MKNINTDIENIPILKLDNNNKRMRLAYVFEENPKVKDKVSSREVRMSEYA